MGMDVRVRHLLVILQEVEQVSQTVLAPGETRKAQVYQHSVRNVISLLEDRSVFDENDILMTFE